MKVKILHLVELVIYYLQVHRITPSTKFLFKNLVLDKAAVLAEETRREVFSINTFDQDLSPLAFLSSTSFASFEAFKKTPQDHLLWCFLVFTTILT